MYLRALPNAFIIIFASILTSSPISVALFSIFKEGQLCVQASKNISCSGLLSFAEFQNNFMYNRSIANITSSRVSIIAKDGFFDVKMKGAMDFPKVQGFFITEEELETDIYMLYTTALFQITCRSYSSQLRMSSNIVTAVDVKSPVHDTYQSTQWHPDVEITAGYGVPKGQLQTGHFTCRSTDERNYPRKIRIFTHSGAVADVSPFVSVQETTIQTDNAGQGFIVPCRTNYKLETPPYLLWAENEEGNFTTLTPEEMKGFRWDPTLGFQFSSSKIMWERKILACRLGSYTKTFFPSLSRFMNIYSVQVEQNEINCKLTKRNHSDQLLVKSNVNLIAKRFHPCGSEIVCDLNWKSGKLERPSLSHNFERKSDSAVRMDYGIISCSFQHDERAMEMSYRKFFEGLDSNVYLLPGVYPTSAVIQISQVDGPFYKSSAELYHEFTCTIIIFVISQRDSVNFILKYKDLTTTNFQKTLRGQGAKPSLSFQFNVTLDSNITHAKCNGFTAEGKAISGERPLKILDVSAPYIENVEVRAITLKVGDSIDNRTLACPITGAPPPKYRWTFNEKNTKLFEGINTRILTFRQVQEEIAGTYICEAWNEYGTTSFEFQVAVQPRGFFSTFSRTTVAWIVCGTILGLCGLNAATVFAFKYFRVKRQIKNLTPQEAREFIDGIPIPGDPASAQYGDGCELALLLPFTKRIEPNALIVARDLILGKGQFGIVYRGIIHAETVAVKTFKRAVTYDEFRAVLIEVKLMNFVGEHPNVVRFIGADVTNIEQREILIVMELSPIGSFEKHLRRLKPSTLPSYENTSKSHYTTADGGLLRQKLFGFCKQIADAMEHLESKKVIHGDLAARNVLVFHHGVVKVTDFGYSRQLYENSTYKPKKSRSLPWRWASIELLRHMEFSSESDIWAFGVTVWEIFTFGNVPFSSMRYSEQFVDSLEKGMRLNTPAGLSESQFSFVKECWNLERPSRPKFSVLKSFFSMEKENVRHFSSISGI